MTADELQNIADAHGLNPYFLAYMLASGFKHPAEVLEHDGGKAEFVAWNIERWAETKKRLGIRPYDPAPAAEHLKTLAACIPDGKKAEEGGGKCRM